MVTGMQNRAVLWAAVPYLVSPWSHKPVDLLLDFLIELILFSLANLAAFTPPPLINPAHLAKPTTRFI